MATTVVQLSDIHLSPRHGFFHANWLRVADRVAQIEADHVVVTGDLSVNGAADEADLRFAVEQCGRLAPPHHLLPGNHDIGETPAGVHLGQVIDADRYRRYRRVAGADRFAVDVEGWRLVGLDSQLIGSGLTEEDEQEDWLADQLSGAPGPIGVFLHTPLFVSNPDEESSPQVVPRAPRRRLLKALLDSRARFVASGHLHRHRVAHWSGIDLVWAPSTAFVAAQPLAGGVNELGWVRYEFDGTDYRVEVDRLPELEVHDLDAIKRGRWEFLYQMPPSPPAGIEPPVPARARRAVTRS